MDTVSLGLEYEKCNGNAGEETGQSRVKYYRPPSVFGMVNSSEEDEDLLAWNQRVQWWLWD
ncbi:hypothetical protein K3495_g5008 [Podosphaera aphanis]|nr:hypothetical protein K3495_g5008 [Podosphaera aphanis]